MRIKIFTLLFFFVFFTNCTSGGENPAPKKVSSSFTYKGEITPGTWLRNLSVPYTYEGKEYNEVIQIYFPKNYSKGKNSRVLFALHGWNANHLEWGANSNITALAEKYNMVIVCPNMKRSLYETAYYNETTIKWSGMPGGKYFGEVLIPYLQKTFALAYDREKTGIMGLSTGGRGAILMAETYPHYFSATAGFSGDYSPEEMTHDRLLRSIYGEYRTFPDRWKNNDNPLHMAENLKDIPVFLSHGGKDKVVSPTQTQIMIIKLNMLHRNGTIKHRPAVQNFPNHSHDWLYWRAVLPHAMSFFDEHLK